MAVLDFNHGALKQRGGVPTTEMLDKGAAGLSSPPRTYLGGSRLGEECARKLQYEYRGTPGKPLTAKLHLIFNAGHSGEDAVAALLRAAGFDLRTHGKDGKQFGFETAGGRIKGHIDGVICGGPAEQAPIPISGNRSSSGRNTGKPSSSTALPRNARSMPGRLPPTRHTWT